MTEQENIVKEVETSKKEKPVKRIPIYKQGKTDYSDIDMDTNKFVYYWVNKIEANINSKISGGYVQVFRKDGKPKERCGKSDPIGQYLFKLPKDLYLQDQQGKLQEPREIEEAMRGGTPKGSIRGLGAEYTYGGVETTTQVGRTMINKTTGEITKIPV